MLAALDYKLVLRAQGIKNLQQQGLSLAVFPGAVDFYDLKVFGT
jgi:hypothetical protein